MEELVPALRATNCVLCDFSESLSLPVNKDNIPCIEVASVLNKITNVKDTGAFQSAL